MTFAAGSQRGLQVASYICTNALWRGSGVLGKWTFIECGGEEASLALPPPRQQSTRGCSSEDEAPRTRRRVLGKLYPQPRRVS